MGMMGTQMIIMMMNDVHELQIWLKQKKILSFETSLYEMNTLYTSSDIPYTCVLVSKSIYHCVCTYSLIDFIDRSLYRSIPPHNQI